MRVGLKERLLNPTVREKIVRAIMAQNKDVNAETADTYAGLFLVQLHAFEWPEFVGRSDRDALAAICAALETFQSKLPSLSAQACSLLETKIGFAGQKDWSGREELVTQIQAAIAKNKDWDAFKGNLGAWSSACRKSLKEIESAPHRQHNFGHEAAHIAYEARQLWQKITGEEAPQKGVSATNPFVLFVQILMEATQTQGSGDAAFNASFDHPQMKERGEQSPK